MALSMKSGWVTLFEVLSSGNLLNGDPFTDLKVSESLNLVLNSPYSIAFLAALLAFLGWMSIADETVYRFYERRRLKSPEVRSLHGLDNYSDSLAAGASRTPWQILQMCMAFSISLIIAVMLTTSWEISIAISLLLTTLPFILARRKAERHRVERDKAWPVVIDEIVASLQAGQSITESLTLLSANGPQQLRQTFARIDESLKFGMDIEMILKREMFILDSATADQTLTTLLFAKEFGGREVIGTLRMLSTFLRDEFKTREEIDTRFGWVRNSAVLGAIAPWLLLALLSTQKSTIEAYQSAAGIFILSIGVVCTAVAFIWMERVSRIPEPVRPLKPALDAQLRSLLLTSASMKVQEGEESLLTGLRER